MSRSTQSASVVLAEKQREATLTEWVLEKCRHSFVQSIPSDSIRTMQPTYMYTFGAIAHALYFSCLIFFAVTGYQNAIDRRFVSLENSNGQCKRVLKPITGTYYASRRGYWEGHSQFEYSNAMYVLDLHNFVESTKRYQYYMSLVEDQLLDLSLQAVVEPLVPNLLYWMTWETPFIPDQGRGNLFRMSGNVLEVMDREYLFGSLATVDRECSNTPTTTYDDTTGLISMTYDASAFATNGTCGDMFNIYELGYRQSYDGEQFKVDVDARSAVVAIAVNAGVIPFSALEIVQGSNFTMSLDDTQFTVTSRYLSRYVGMAPLLCAETMDGTSQGCFVRIGRTFGLPVMNHYGDYNSENFPEPCTCKDLNGNCEAFDLMLDILFYNDDITYTQYYALLLYQLRSYRQTSDLAYYASVYANTFNEHNATKRTEAYDFCVIGNYTCKVLNVNVFDKLNTRVSEYYYQLHDGHCTNTFTTHAWHMLRETPPTQLTEEYYECRATWHEALLIGVGLARGNTNTLIPIVMLLLLPLIYLIMHCLGTTPRKEKYSEEELSAANRAFATFLLKIRDGEDGAVASDGVLKQLAKELVAASQAENGIVVNHAVAGNTTPASLQDTIFTVKCDDFTSVSPHPNPKQSDDVEASVGIELNPVAHTTLKINRLLDKNGYAVINDVTLDINRLSTITSREECREIVESAVSSNMQSMSRKEQLQVYSALTSRFLEMNLQYILQDEAIGCEICDHLYTLLLAHAAAKLNCLVAEVAQTHTNILAYQFADRCYTASELLRFSLGRN